VNSEKNLREKAIYDFKSYIKTATLKFYYVSESLGRLAKIHVVGLHPQNFINSLLVILDNLCFSHFRQCGCFPDLANTLWKTLDTLVM
jgi:hypothetical protein